MSEKQDKHQIKVRYSETSALFASQFIVNTTNEDLTINFSSGPIVDPAGGDTVLPVHTRIAMTMAAAKRLHGVLDSILNTQKSGDAPAAAQAQLPKIQQ